MKMRSILILSLLNFYLLGCNQETPRTKKLDKNKTTYERAWFVDTLGNGVIIKEDVYISSNSDTISFQQKLYKNGVLDTVNSHFYTLESYYIDEEPINKLTFYSRLDSKNDVKLIQRELTFSYLQEQNDSLYFKDVKVEDNNEIYFKYKNYRDGDLVGVLFEYRVYEDTTNSEKVNLTYWGFPIDNKYNTDNPFIKIHDLGKK